MRIPWLTFRLRTLMVLVAITAVACSVEATRRRWAFYREKAAFHALESRKAEARNRLMDAMRYRNTMTAEYNEHNQELARYHAKLAREYQERW